LATGKDSRVRILLVDDSPGDLALARREVARALPDAEIEEAGTPAALDDALGRGAVDLAILDYSLGWSNGSRVLARLRHADPTAAAILLTGSLGEEGAVEAMKAGFDDYVLKGPTAGLRLRAAIEGVLGRAVERRAVRRAEARYRDLLDTVSVGVFACHPDGRFKEGNPALLDLIGVDAHALTEVNLLDLAEAEALRRHWLDQTPLHGFEAGLVRPDGRRIEVLIDASARGPTIDGLMTDVTALRNAVRQKDVLLREVLHRVYNNLQQVEALLNLQGRRFEDPGARQAFKDVGDRLRSLALVQQKLYQGDDYRSVNFAAYLKDLASAISAMARRPEIEIVVDAEPLALDVDKAIPLSMIANELLTNSVKHAFVDGRGGRIDVVMRREADDRLCFEVSDDGVGADPQIVVQGQGLGARLIPSLARQLSAEMTVEDAGGLRTTLRAPL
jgi:PAS domain S-box-containing protein